MHQIYFWINVAAGTVLLLVFFVLLGVLLGCIRDLLRKLTK